MPIPSVFDELREALALRGIAERAVGIHLAPALVTHHRTGHRDAKAVIDQIIERNPQPAHTVLEGDIVAALGQADAGSLASCARNLGQAELASKFRAATETEDDSAPQGAQMRKRERITMKNAR